MFKKQKIVNKLILPDDIWRVISEFIDNINDLNNFEITCKTFYFIVEDKYKKYFGKKLFNNVDVFMKSDNFSYFDNQVGIKEELKEMKALLFFYCENSNDCVPYIDDLQLFEPMYFNGYKVKDHFQKRIIYKKNNVYFFYQSERIWTEDECTEFYGDSEGKQKSIEEKIFKIFFQKIKGYFFL